jgi:hypothetical protein
MPSAHGSSYQRRTFRGRGGPTDGNLPPKKTVRRRFKYQGVEGSSNAQTGRCAEGIDHENNADDGSTMTQLCVEKLSITNNRNERDDDVVVLNDDTYDKLLLELKHLRRRIQHLVDSFRTSQGMGNPKTWESNCLLPTKNAVNEWRSIVKFYNLLDTLSHYYYDDDNDTGDCRNVHLDNASSSLLLNRQNNIPGENSNSNSDAGGGDTMDIIDSTTQEVFGLIQMSIQIGPLSGSNPGYFKRCGGEVATVALVFLSGIADLAVDVSSEQKEVITGDNVKDSAVNGAQHSCSEEARLLYGHGCGSEEKANSINSEYNDEYAGSDDEFILSARESSSDSEQDDYDDDDESSHAKGDETLSTGNYSSFFVCDTSPLTPPSNAASRRGEVICILQNSYLFTEKQSDKFYQWMCNAEIASRKKKPPSKSAVKLQSLKSKKQKQKELKIERKMKKK